jgi:hypothetical protein
MAPPTDSESSFISGVNRTAASPLPPDPLPEDELMLYAPPPPPEPVLGSPAEAEVLKTLDVEYW